MVNNIYTNLSLPINVVIDFDLVPSPLPTRAARKMEEKMLVNDVLTALNRWYYEEYVSE